MEIFFKHVMSITCKDHFNRTATEIFFSAEYRHSCFITDQQRS